MQQKSRYTKPLRKIEKGSRGYELRKLAQMTIGSGNMQRAVELPSGEDLNEWLAVNTIEFFNEINLLYGVLIEFCTQKVCSIMSAGPKYHLSSPLASFANACAYLSHIARYEYLWADG